MLNTVNVVDPFLFVAKVSDNRGRVLTMLNARQAAGKARSPADACKASRGRLAAGSGVVGKTHLAIALDCWPHTRAGKSASRPLPTLSLWTATGSPRSAITSDVRRIIVENRDSLVRFRSIACESTLAGRKWIIVARDAINHGTMK